MSVVDVLLGDERRLDVDLGELGLAVGAQVLVAEAAGDLQVAAEPGDLEQLLEQLRRLGQGVERAAVEPRRDQEVARPLGGRAGQDRRLDLDEAHLVEVAAGLGDAPGGGAPGSPSSPAGADRGSGASGAAPRRRWCGPRRRTAASRPRLRSSSEARPPTSISPVASSGLAWPAARSPHRPAHPDHVLGRQPLAVRDQRVLEDQLHRPERSRRSTKTRPPRSRRRRTQPTSSTDSAEVGATQLGAPRSVPRRHRHDSLPVDRSSARQ